MTLLLLLLLLLLLWNNSRHRWNVRLMPLLLTLKARGQTVAPGPSGFCNQPLSIDLCGITPDRMTTLSLDGILRLPIAADGRACELGELFSATGAATDGQMECSGDFSAVHHVGAAMAWGEISVKGDVGRHAGAAMSGGTSSSIFTADRSSMTAWVAKADRPM